MSINSPLIPPGANHRRALARRRRTLRRRLVLVFGIMLLGAFAIDKGISLLQPYKPSGAASSSSAIPRATVEARGGSAQAPLRTSGARLGLPLGKPPLRLTMASAREIVNVSFRHPPRAGLLFDLDSGRVFWQRDATRILPIASLAKMMTALLAARSLSPTTRVLVTHSAVNAVGSKVGLLPLGKRVSARALLYGLLLPSGNDAAVALAQGVSGSVPRFVTRMNAEAAHLGLGCTRLSSPDGLDDANSSCAVDLAVLAYADLSLPALVPIVRSARAIVPFPIKGGKLFLYNNNPLLRYGYPGATGLKTGETNAAGLCLVGTAERSRVRLGVVLLHSPELGRQAAYLLDRGFEHVYHQPAIPEPPIPKGR